MSTTKKNTSSSSAKTSSFKGYINYQPDEHDKRAFNEQRSKVDLLGTLFYQVCQSGYKLSVVYIEQNDCYSAALYATDKVANFAGFCLTVRAGDPITAIERVLWVHIYKFDGDWSNQVDTGWADDRW